MIDEDGFYLSVGELKKHLKNVPDDTPVYYQRIEDWCFDKGGWDTKPLIWYFNETTDCIKAFGSYLDEENNAFVIHAHY